MTTPAKWEEEFDRRFATNGCESPIGFTACPEPTTASQVVKEYIRTLLSSYKSRLLSEVEGKGIIFGVREGDAFKQMSSEEIIALISKEN